MNIFYIKKVEAVCPVCTIAVGTGVEISRLLGIDDAITGVWIGGLIISAGLWLADFFKNKQWKIPFPEFISIFLMGIFLISFLYWSKMIGIKNNTMFGIDKIIFGIIIGSIVFFLSVLIDKKLRLVNKGKVFIYYQKVILPIFFLSVTSLILFLIISY